MTIAFGLTDEQRQLAASVARLLADSARKDPLPPAWADVPIGFNRALWDSLAELGLLGLAAPESSGGGGAGLLEVCLVAERVGYEVAAVPFVGTEMVIAVLATSGSDLVGQIMSGAVVVAPVWSSFPASVVPGCRRGELTLTDGRLDGVLAAVPFGLDADLALGFAGSVPVLVDLAGPGVRRSSVASLDVLEPVARVQLSGAPATALPAPEVFPAAEILTVLAAELTGVGQRALDGAVVYARERRQFGRAIGSFQAIKHLLADRHVQLDAARLLVHEAAIQPTPLTARTALMAASDAADAAAGDALQVHGGIGFTWEHPSHVLLKRARARRALLGSSARQLEEVAALVLS